MTFKLPHISPSFQSSLLFSLWNPCDFYIFSSFRHFLSFLPILLISIFVEETLGSSNGDVDLFICRVGCVTDGADGKSLSVSPCPIQCLSDTSSPCTSCSPITLTVSMLQMTNCKLALHHHTTISAHI